MITGGCPYCDQIVMNAMPDESPAFANPTCENCGKKYWLLCSRLDSKAYTEEDFLNEYEVNEVTKSIKRKAR